MAAGRRPAASGILSLSAAKVFPDFFGLGGGRMTGIIYDLGHPPVGEGEL